MILKQARSITLLTILAVIALIEVVHGIEIIALLPLYLKERFNDGGSLAGLLISAYLLSDIVVRPPAGWLADKIDRRVMLAAGLLISLFVVLLLAAANTIPTLVAVSILNGIGAGMIWPTMYALLADMYGRKRRGLILGLVNMVMLGGLGLGPIVGNILLQAGTYPLAFWVCGIVLVIAFLAGMVGIRRIRTEFTQLEDSAEHSTITANPAPLLGKGQVLPHTGTDLERDDLRWNLVWLAAMGVCMSLAVSLLVPILNRYGEDVLQISLVAFALVLLPPGFITAVSLVPLGHLADRYGRRLPMIAGLLVLAGAFWAAPVTTVPWVVSLGGCLAGLGYALAVPAWNALVMDCIPQDRRGTMLGWVAALQAAGGAIGPLVSGYAWQYVHHYAPFLTAGAFFTLALICSLLIREK